MEVRSEEMLSSFLSFPWYVTIYRQLNSRIRSLATYKCGRHPVKAVNFRRRASARTNCNWMLAVEPWSPEHAPFVHPIGVGPIDRSPSASCNRNPSFLGPLFISIFIYFCMCLFLSLRVSIFSPLCLIPFHSNLSYSFIPFVLPSF